MSIRTLADVSFGEELPVFDPDTGIQNVRRFCQAANWMGPRFTDHESAKKRAFPAHWYPAS